MTDPDGNCPLCPLIPIIKAIAAGYTINVTAQTTINTAIDYSQTGELDIVEGFNNVDHFDAAIMSLPVGRAAGIATKVIAPAVIDVNTQGEVSVTAADEIGLDEHGIETKSVRSTLIDASFNGVAVGAGRRLQKVVGENDKIVKKADDFVNQNADDIAKGSSSNVWATHKVSYKEGEKITWGESNRQNITSK